MRELSIDIETYSDRDLTRVGVYAYADSPAFRILLFAYAFDDGPVQIVDFEHGEKLPDTVVKALADPEIIKTAYNANFERVCISVSSGFGYFRYLPPEQWRCTAVAASELGLPNTLDGVAQALHLSFQKDKRGKDLINYFCKPNPKRESNQQALMDMDAEKWEEFKEYCKQDVEVERAIKKKISRFPMPESEQKLWELDQRINDRGICIDRKLVENAISFSDAYVSRAEAQFSLLTGIENPKSVVQIKNWLKKELGEDISSADKKALAELRARTMNPRVKEVLRLRALIAKSSVSKYEAMKRSLCDDGRIRGTMQFYGANRTGRWAGRIIQPQNFPQNHLPDLKEARETLKEGNLDWFETLYGDVTQVLSELIRTAIIPKSGHRFIVSDFSAIEARVIAYLADENWRIKLFKDNGDIYCSSASQMFKVPVVKNGINGHLRQKGKIAELACIAEGQIVLTDKGLVPIEDVTTEMKVWDGENWIEHKGVVCRGEKEVISYGGLEATKDHIVWAEIKGKPRKVYFGIAATCGAHLIQTGNGRNPVRLDRNNQSGKEMEREMEPLLCFNQMRRMRKSAVDEFRKFKNRKIKRVPKLFTTKSRTELVRSEIYGGETTLHESEGQKLQKLWSQRHRVSVCKRNRCLYIHDRNTRITGARNGVRPDRCKWPLRTGESTLGNTPGELSESKKILRKVKVYDLLNAGPNHRFTVSNVLVHNCGYGGGVGALKAMGALEMGLEESELQPIVDKWRNSNPHITEYWRTVETAAVNAINDKPSRIAHGISFQKRANILFVTLPSGRKIAYVKPRIGENKFGGQSICYMGLDTAKHWTELETWGGKLVENIVQAVARDCLAESLKRLEKVGYRAVFHVHDEVIIEAPEDFGSLEDVTKIMSQPMPWTEGLPLNAAGFECEFYQKD